jgi:hypothetical protein
MFALLPVGSIAISGSVIHLGVAQNTDTAESFSYGSVENLAHGRPIIKDLSLEIPLFGYRITPRSMNPLAWDMSGLMTLRGVSTDSISVHLSLGYGTFEYKDLLVTTATAYTDSSGNTAYYLEASNVTEGFFMDLTELPWVTFVDLAFGGAVSQLRYRGVSDVGSSLMWAQTPSRLQNLEHSEFSFLVPQYASAYTSLSFADLNQTLRADYQKDFQIYISPSYQKQLASADSTSALPAVVVPDITRYGVCEQWATDVDGGNSLPGQLPSSYWQGYCVDIGIHNYDPAKATIESDLQDYNEWQSTRYQGYENDMLVFAIYAHSGPTVNTTWYEYSSGGSSISPTEVSALWYRTVSGGLITDVHPRQTVILATVCYGYSGNDGIPYMAKAFVNNGGAAFVGATVEVPNNHNDDFTSYFWTSLCINHRSVYNATISYINRYNYWYGSGSWNYGNQIQIYGNTNFVVQ